MIHNDVKDLNNNVDGKYRMKNFYTSNKSKAIHNINYFNWEQILDKIYVKVVDPSIICYGIICNSEKQSNSDIYGHTSEYLIHRFHKNIDKSHHKIIASLQKIVFDNIFKQYLSIDYEKRSDFYHIEKKYGIGLEILVYPLVGKDNKKGMILVDFEKSKQEDLDKIVDNIFKYIDQ